VLRTPPLVLVRFALSFRSLRPLISFHQAYLLFQGFIVIERNDSGLVTHHSQFFGYRR